MSKFHRIIFEKKKIAGQECLHKILGNLDLSIPGIDFSSLNRTYWFTEKGMAEYGDEAIELLEEHGFSPTIEVRDDIIGSLVYEDEFQVVVDV